MGRIWRRMAAWCRVYRGGLPVGVFFMTAAVTCGLMRGKTIAVSDESEVVFGVTSYVRSCVHEAGFCAALLVASLHPFGCAMNAGMICFRGYHMGYMLGISNVLEQPVYMPVLTLSMIVQTMLCLYGCCISAYTALQTGQITRREMPGKLLNLLGCMLIAALLRCTVFYMIQ